MPCEAGMPYEAGKTLTLSTESETLIARVVRLIQPSTFSCVMLVESVKDWGPTILKLYDWRYATELRKYQKVGTWTQSHADAYRAFVENGDAAKFVMTLDDGRDYSDSWSWDRAHDEAYLFNVSRDRHRNEVNAYNNLKNLQGKNVPRFFADVHVDAFSRKHPLFEVRGILIEFIEGYCLSELLNEPESTWQSVCDEAVRTINLIGDHGVLNEDVRPDKIILRKRATSPAPEVFVIDFGQCRFREDYESDAEWMHEKSVQDEEGAVGWVMARRLGGMFEYKPSYRYYCRCSKCTSPE